MPPTVLLPPAVPTFVDLFARHGRGTMAYQSLDAAFLRATIPLRMRGQEAGGVAFVDTTKAWVAAGPPLCAPEHVGDVMHRFVAQAAAQGRRACFFGVDDLQGLWPGNLARTAIGLNPQWKPKRWQLDLTQHPSLRAQLRRGRAKGLEISALSALEMQAWIHPLSAQMSLLMQRWLTQKAMPPMHFVVRPLPLVIHPEQQYFVAHRNGELVGFANLAPWPARQGFNLHHLVRDPNAPNGCAEMLVDAAMTWAANAGAENLSMGLCPLAGAVPWWLKFARAAGQPWFNFSGLYNFRNKMRPHAVDRVFIYHKKGIGAGLTAVADSMTAFAGGPLFSFAARALRWRLGTRNLTADTTQSDYEGL